MKTALREEYLRRALKICRKPVIAIPRGASNKRAPQISIRSTLLLLIAAPAGFLVALGGHYAQAQAVASFQTLYSFTNGADGATLEAGLVLSAIRLYRTAVGGGTNGNGTVFSVNTDGSDFRVLHAFTASSYNQYGTVINFDGAEPRGGLVLSNNAVYGTTFQGGPNGLGTVYSVNTDGTGFATLHNFTVYDGGGSYGGLIIQGSTLYGTSTMYPSPSGNVFAVNTAGTGFASVYNFSGDDGSDSYATLLLSGSTLYGTASEGGANGGGTVFAVNTNGMGFSVLHSFSDRADGSGPAAGLVQSGNTLYGTAYFGGNFGTYTNGTVFAVSTNGTAFKVLHSFNGIDGGGPSASLVLSGNTLYGTTVLGGKFGTYNNGTVFAVNTDGTAFTVVHNFQGSDGALPYGGLVLSGNTLYGTTWQGGRSGAGTIFAITLPSIPTIDPYSVSASGGQLQFVVSGLTPGATVYIQSSSDLSATGAWLTVATNVATGANLTVSGLSATNANSRFFRVLEAAPP